MPHRVQTLASSSLESALDAAVSAARKAGPELQQLLDTFTAPIYVTDADGWVTFYNRPCVDFAGRTPVAGQDRWCVTWRLHSEDGQPISHDTCPMAVAIREKRQVRGVIAVAERPDGTRVIFAPYPTPIIDDSGVLLGAVNMLIDVTDARQTDSLRAQARRCRRLAQSVTDRRTVDTLRSMAREYEDEASRLGASRDQLSPQPPRVLSS